MSPCGYIFSLNSIPFIFYSPRITTDLQLYKAKSQRKVSPCNRPSLKKEILGEACCPPGYYSFDFRIENVELKSNRIRLLQAKALAKTCSQA
jgi:hypothetical protein